MTRYFIEVRYNGAAFHGSQIQGDIPTVQLALNKAISTILRQEIETYGASRTDEGVHALCSYYHFDLEISLPDNFKYKLNSILSADLSINKIFKTIDPEYNCRFAAISRTYRYKTYTEKDPFKYQRAYYFPFHIDRAILNETAALLKEYTDFETFSKRNTQSYTFNCQLFESYWENVEDELHYIVKGNRFLRGMVRGLVGTQLQVARGRTSMDEFKNIIESKDCTQADFSVPGHGLYLEHIEYPGDALIEITDQYYKNKPAI